MVNITRMSVYFDSASATTPDIDILEKFLEMKKDYFANPSSYTTSGSRSKALLERSRLNISKVLKCLPSQVYFTNSITESSNMVVQGVVSKNTRKGCHIICTTLDHISVKGFKDFYADNKSVNVDVIPTDSDGKINVKFLLNQICDETRLICFPIISSEIGVVQNIGGLLEEIEKINLDRSAKGLGKVLVYVDGASLPRYLDIDLSVLNVDFMSISSNKIYGMGGSSLLFIRNQESLNSIFVGGNQESGLLPGTEKAVENYCLSLALEKTQINIDIESKKVGELRKYLLGEITGICEVIELPNQLDQYLFLKGFRLDQQTLLTKLDMEGVETSLGSVCSSGGVVKASYMSEFHKDESVVRVVLDKNTGRSDIDKLVFVLNKCT